MKQQLDAPRPLDETFQALRQGGFRSFAERAFALGAERILWLGRGPGRWHVRRDRRRDGGPRLRRVAPGSLLEQVADKGEARAWAFEILRGYPCAVTLPLVEDGVMILLGRAFDEAELPSLLLWANLCGRDEAALELRCIAEIQRSLLPEKLPAIPTLELAAYYRPVARAGGDYYDFIPLPGRRWGILIADASGHGCGAAVEMAITRTLVHTSAERMATPGGLLAFLNEHLAARHNVYHRAFVTAFYAIYDPVGRELRFASAGHPSPRLKRCSTGELFDVKGPRGPALGVLERQTYPEARLRLQTGDQLVLYTDGITEAFNGDKEQFGSRRLDRALQDCRVDARGLVRSVIRELERFTGAREAADDRTLLAARVVES